LLINYEWFQYFEEDKLKAPDIVETIHRKDTVIDGMVYQLDGLREVDSKIVEG
jgi:hypothetical protein